MIQKLAVRLFSSWLIPLLGLQLAGVPLDTRTKRLRANVTAYPERKACGDTDAQVGRPKSKPDELRAGSLGESIPLGDTVQSTKPLQRPHPVTPYRLWFSEIKTGSSYYASLIHS